MGPALEEADERIRLLLMEELDGYDKTGGGDDKSNYTLAYYGPSVYQEYGYYGAGYDYTLGPVAAVRDFPILKITSDFFLSETISAPQPFTMSDSGFEAVVSSAGMDSTDGHQFEKKIRAARIGLPPTKVGAWSDGSGFLDINAPFIHRIQQRYIKWKNEPTATANTFDTWLNIDIGFDRDTDGIPFEEYYLEDYPSAPWTTIEEDYSFLARISQFYYGWEVAESSGFDFVAFMLVYFSAHLYATTASDAMFTGDWTSYGYARTPIEEVFYTSQVDNLEKGAFFYEGVDPLVGWDSFDKLGDLDVGVDKYYPKHNAVDDSVTTLTYYTSTEDADVAVFSKTNYDYKKSGDGKETWEDIIKRFKSLDYVKTFSSELISHRLDQVAALLTTSVSREADIKMQKNQPLRYTLATAMADDYSTMDTPDTSVSSTGIESYSSADPMGTTGGAGGGGGTY